MFNLTKYQVVKAKCLEKSAQLVAVSKTRSVEELKELYSSGARAFGENRVQELLEKRKHLAQDIEWHLIGHLQSNKVKYIADFIHLIHSVDSIRLLVEIQKEAKKNDNGRRWRWMRNNDDILYKNINEGRQIDQSDLFGKNFIVEDTCQTWKWKIYAAEQRDVQGFTCMKAIFQDSTSMLEAWFTPQIPISNGPHIYGGLPGLILEMRMENRHIVATKIEEYTQLEPYPTPSDGEVITKEEYDKIKEEKQKEREAMWRGGARKRRF